MRPRQHRDLHRDPALSDWSVKDVRHFPRAAAAAAAVLLLFASAAATAAPSESHPDCEAGQENRLAPAPVMLCEGEHWDGQDPFEDGEGLVVRYGAPGSPSPAAPASAGVHVHGGAVFVFGTLYGAGESSLWVDAASGTVAWWARDGTNQLLADTPVVIVMTSVDDALGRGNAGGDGNAVAWLVGLASTLAHTAGAPGPAGEQTGEGDCDQATYAASDCARDDTAVTIVLP